MNKPGCGQSPALVDNIADMKKEIAAMKATLVCYREAAVKGAHAIAQSRELLKQIEETPSWIQGGEHAAESPRAASCVAPAHDDDLASEDAVPLVPVPG